ncbi:hypothetical protein QK313_32000 [Klebsiella michiganensis]|uniref:hypothetical protein n=1 Tax=Klebsiella michiganensis TaxID=1134687 RepID=UPI00249C30D8|nr:hypothetical protein [Klebsiella michiganensis]MDI3172504.1 hypothetical protein [Klebsiella michiganensis]
MTSLKTSIKTITYLSDIGCLEIQGASLVTTFLVLFGLSFAYVDTTKRSERHFAERRKAQAQGATFSMMWDALDSDAKQLFYQKIDVESASSEFKSRYQQLQNEISYWDKEIERLR